MDRKISLSLLGRIFLLAALTLSACAPQLPTPTPVETVAPPTTVAPTDTSTPTLQATSQPTQPVVENSKFGLACEPNKEINFNKVLETTPFYIKGQVILTGPADRIPGTIKDLADAGIDLTPVFLCTMGIPTSMPLINLGNRPFIKLSNQQSKNTPGDGSYASFPFRDPEDSSRPKVEGNSLAMNLYQFDYSKVKLIDIIQTVNDLQKDPQKYPNKFGKVYADPNYLTGQMANTACGSPFGVAGSPFGVAGSPFGGMGLNADASGFWVQWAFQRVGLSSSTPNRPEKRNFVETGKGVRVGVFDSSPYTSTPGMPPITKTNTDINPELKLTVHYLIQLSNLSTTTPNPPDVKDHGLFVSSLIHAFAYESQIDLYRVLDDAGCGDLYRLNVAILDFLSANWNWSGKASELGLSQPAVVNLSLGVRKPRHLPTNSQAYATAEAEISQMGEAIQDAYNVVQADPSIESLETVIQLAYQAGMVIAAAGGNDSVITAPPPLPMDLPADYNIVIGVSASTKTDGPACYSNEGDVVAPGGEAPASVGSNGDPMCESRAATCPLFDSTTPNNAGSCEYGVIGLSTVSTTTHYAYWVGTSFATPMVSGLAALVYQQRGNSGDTWIQVTTQISPALGLSYGSGLINVQKALGP